MVKKIIFFVIMGFLATVVTYVYILDVLGAETFKVFIVMTARVLPYFLLLIGVTWVMKKKLFKK